ncbi:MAG: hypothetical protein N4A74_22990, partial [Carboxylicivirga sp.]|nr:hypothetical protein [Carboxylicivirga sp.]
MDTLGRNIPVIGMVYDENKKKIALIRSVDQGRGCFSIKPHADMAYHAVVNFSQDTVKLDLPKVKAQGYVINVLNKYRNNRLIVQVSTNTSSESGKLYLVASQRGVIRSCIESETSSKGRIIKLDKNKFKTGIVQLILLDQFLKPQAERLVYVNHNDGLSVDIQPSDTAYSKRQEISADVIVKDADNKPVEGDFSIAVTDLGQISSTFYKEDMYDYMKLACDFPEAQNSLINMLGDTRRAHMRLDLVMLTKGWRRFNWYPSCNDLNDKPAYQLEQFSYLKTKLKKPGSHKSIRRKMNVKVLAFQKGMPDIYEGVTDKEGEFNFELLSYTDTVKLLVQTSNGEDIKKDVFIELESNLPFIDELYDSGKTKTKIIHDNDLEHRFESNLDEIEEIPHVLNSYVKKPEETRRLDLGLPTDSLNIMIKEVDIVANKIKTKREEMTKQYGSPSVVINERQIEAIQEQTPWSTGLIDLLFDQFPELTISTEPARLSQLYGREQEQNVSINAIIDMRKSHAQGDSIYQPEMPELEEAKETIRFQLTRGGERRFIVCFDGEVVATTNRDGYINRVSNPHNVNDIITFDPHLVKTVELITDLKENLNRDLILDLDVDFDNLAVDDVANESVILAIYTKHGQGLFSNDYKKGIIQKRLVGFMGKREFYNPDYSSANDQQVLSDTRTTVYWNGELKTDEQGKGQIQFFNSDVARGLRFDLAGISGQGQIAAKRVEFGLKPDWDQLKNGMNDSAKVLVEEEASSIINWNDYASNYSKSKQWLVRVVDNHEEPIPFADIQVQDK